MNEQSAHLSALEAKARKNALKRVAEQFQKPEQLDNIDLTRTRFLSIKTATEVQLKMALYSQLDGSKVGLEKLDSALKESQVCRNRLLQLESALATTSNLSSDLHELKTISTKYGQLAAAMENMSYLVKAPESFEQAFAYLESENILDAHKIMQELEGIRDELMCELHKRKSVEDLETLRTYFKDLSSLNDQFRQKISTLGLRLTSAAITQNSFLTSCIRVIDREERADLIWLKRSEKHGFIPDGRPKHWKQILFDNIFENIKNKVMDSALDNQSDKNRLVRHNELIRQHAMSDLKIAKNICPTYFPPDYGIFDRFVEMYHDAIAMHVDSLVREGLSDTQIVQLLGWINSYHNEEFMKNPYMNIDFSRLNLKYPINLLPENKLDSLRKQYISKTIDRLKSWLTNSLTKDASDWQRSTAPELDGSSNYFTDLPVLVMTPVNEMIGRDNLLHYLGNAVREQFLIECVEQMTLFVNDYGTEIKKYRSAYVQNRSVFSYYIEFILANANGANVIAESFTAVIMQELAEDLHLKGKLSGRINQLRENYEGLADNCLKCAEEVVIMDLKVVLNGVMTAQWLSASDMTAQYWVGTLDDYNETLHHLRKDFYVKLAERLSERILIEYLNILLVRRFPFTTDEQRHLAGEKIARDGQILRTCLKDKFHVAAEILNCYDALTAIGQIFLTSDTSMISLDIYNLQHKFPDIREDQMHALLLARGDIRADAAKKADLKEIKDEAETASVGPHLWAQQFPNARGTKQSPIILDTSCMKYDNSLPPISIDFSGVFGENIVVKDHNFSVEIKGDGILKGGPLDSVYKFAQFHFHWGSGDNWGSEHLVNGVSCPAELHCVFYNEKYGSVQNAMTYSDGLAVVGVFLELSDQSNTALDQILFYLKSTNKGQQVEVNPLCNLNSLLPTNMLRYYTYSGSLTTPPCNECVTWIVMDEPVPFTQQQLHVFRSMHANCAVCGKTDNFRPICPIGDRCVRSSFATN